MILWDAATGALRKRITGFADRVGALDFSNNGKLLATGGQVARFNKRFGGLSLKK